MPAGAATSPVPPPERNENEAEVPHTAFHYTKDTDRRVFEGWYCKVAVLNKHDSHSQSYAFVHEMEDPAGSQFTKVTSQVLGPKGQLLLQHTRDVGCFWADKEHMAFGACYQSAAISASRTSSPTAPNGKNKGSGDGNGNGSSSGNGGSSSSSGRLGNAQTDAPGSMVPEEEFHGRVALGYQSTDTWHQGQLAATEPEGDMLRGEREGPNTAKTCSWAYSLKPVYGWGDSVPEGEEEKDKQSQKATTGWLAASPVFDPQWQVCVAHALATGWIEVDGERCEFEDAPAYIEKNWGNGFPNKWFWLQCNSFQGQPELTVTAVGANRRMWQPYGGTVDVGILGVHYEGEFVEMVPWKASMSWEVEPWGSWKMSGKNGEYDVEIEATTSDDGTYLRGPHEGEGFIPICRDSCEGSMRLRVWRRQEKPSLIPAAVAHVAAAVLPGVFGADKQDAGGSSDDESGSSSSDEDGCHEKRGELLVDAHSSSAAVEVGGGPWDNTWTSRCTVPDVLKEALKQPFDLKKAATDLITGGGGGSSSSE